MSLPYMIGSGLLLWLAFDLYSGTVWLHREYSRQEEPAAYWGLVMLWLLVALSCFVWEV